MFGKLNGAARTDIDVSIDKLAQIVDLARERAAADDSRHADVSVSGAAPARLSVDASLRREIGNLSEDQQAVLVALTWIGSGRYNVSEFDLALTQAFDRRGGTTADYLLAMPDFPIALEHGAAACGAEFDEDPDSRQSVPNGSDLH